MNQKGTYEIMHGEMKAAQLDTQGLCHFCDESRMPCHLYLEEGTDIDPRIDNLTNFYYWCATRLLTLDRRYAKELLGSIGASQASTDRPKDRPVPDPGSRGRLVLGPPGGVPHVLHAQTAPGRSRRSL